MRVCVFQGLDAERLGLSDLNIGIKLRLGPYFRDSLLLDYVLKAPVSRYQMINWR